MMFSSYSNSKEAVHELTSCLILYMSEKDGDHPFCLALSGGETAKDIFRLWTEEYSEKIDWMRIRFYWVDERCVPPDSVESNYHHARELLFVPLGIPSEHIHRIRGENVPEVEAGRYENEVGASVRSLDNLPLFDCIILGVGEDMHTASIFPHCMELLADKKLYAVSRHPKTGQYRVTMTGKAILCGAPLLIPVWGESKAGVIASLRNLWQNCGRMQDVVDDSSPISFIVSSAGDLAQVFAVL
ncbi:MAG: 6-phosphogluconolactonase [Bacteroides sp.]|nr:6-phosphogluconolactonase [Roseburia sp.]MCM1345641.1 6-phosphogluconolactonase [Bacteroides sp.]MCM1420945.1 6-phosphogluconolactonase [Bacteroides sp.]